MSIHVLHAVRSAVLHRHILAIGLLIISAAATIAGEVALIDQTTPLRCWIVHGYVAVREEGDIVFRDRRRQLPFDTKNRRAPYGKKVRTISSPWPPDGWQNGDFDAGCWPRFYPVELAEVFNSFHVHNDVRQPVQLCLRTAFGIENPAEVGELTLTVRGTAGAVFFVNGVEVGRHFLPAGDLTPLSLAEALPDACYVEPDGKTPLVVQKPSKHHSKPLSEALQQRVAMRLRTMSVTVPADVLRPGGNTLAVALHRAPVTGPMKKRHNNTWPHVQFDSLSLTSADGAGVIPYAKAIDKTYVWSAPVEEQIAETPSEEAFGLMGGFKTFIWDRAMPHKGIQFGNPFDPLRPVRLAVPRTGFGCGQVVVSDPGGLTGVTATLDPLAGSGGAVIDPAAVEISYAATNQYVHYCDTLQAKAPADAKTIPVWLTVTAKADQAPGWYTSTLTITANGKSFAVPVEVLVSGCTLPPSREYRSHISLVHSPDTIAEQYKVQPWSDEHFRLMEPTLRMLGQVGNDVVMVPVITRNMFNWHTPMIRFVRKGGELHPDFAVLERYLDHYSAHCNPPKRLSLNLWDQNCAKRKAYSREGNQQPSRSADPGKPLMVHLVDPTSGTTSEVAAPHIGDPGAEGFYTRILAGARAILERRGWPTDALVIGCGTDHRPSVEDSALIKRWAPEVRWHLLSHFSGDPCGQEGGARHYKGPWNELLAQGKLMCIGDLEVALKEAPFTVTAPWRTTKLEARLSDPPEYLDLATARWVWQEYSTPQVFRTMPLMWGHLGRVGLDFWHAKNKKKGAAHNDSYFTDISVITVPGPEGALPTVRSRMLRLGVQDLEVRLGIIAKILELPEAERAPYRKLLDGLYPVMLSTPNILPQRELANDYPAYHARVLDAAARLMGRPGDPAWQEGPR